MKCPNCNQEIVDNKVFCTNCGKKLNDLNKGVMEPKKLFLIVVVLMLLLGVGTIYIVANVGTKTELENIITPKTTVSSFYDSYLVKSIITTEDTPLEIVELKDDLINFEMDLTKDNFKIGLFQLLWAKIEKPAIKVIDSIQKYKDELKLTDEKSMAINIQGVNKEKDGGQILSFDMINIGTKTYLYYLDTYFELAPSSLGFKTSKTYYKVNLLKEVYNKDINEQIKEINKKVKTDIESEAYEIYMNYYEEYTDNDVIHLVIREVNGYINSGMITNIKTMSFNKNSGAKYNLKAYVEHIGKKYEDIVKLYETNRETVYASSVDGATAKFETNPDLIYYVKENKIYIACGTDNWGMLFAEVDLKGE